MNEDRALEQDLRSVNAEVPELVHLKIEETLSALLHEPRRRKPIHKLWIPAASIFMVFLCLFAVGFVSPTMAQYLERMPFIGMAFKRAGDPGIQNYEGVSNLNLTAIDQGIPITLDQVAYDGTRLSIGFIHHSNLRISFSPVHLSLTVDGRKIHGSGGAVSKEIGNEYAASVYHMVPSGGLPDSFEATLAIHEITLIGDRETETVAGTWEFPLQVEKISENVLVKPFQPPLVKSHDGTTIEITEVTATPLTTKVSFRMVESEKYRRPDLGETQPDEFVFHRLMFTLADERGVQLQPLSQSGSGAPGEPTSYEALFEPIAQPAKYVTFLTMEETNRMKKVGEGAYTSAEPPEVMRVNIPDSFPFTVKQGEAGELTVHSIEYYPDKTMITFSVQGATPHMQDGAWWIEDEAGNKYDFDRYDQIRLNDNPFTYEVALPSADPDARLKLAVVQLTAPKTIPELEFRIPLE